MADAAAHKHTDGQAEQAEVLAFRSDARAYRHAWDFLSQIVDYQDPTLHRRAILAGLPVRNLHIGALVERIDTSSIELIGLAVVAEGIDEDHSTTAPEPAVLKPSGVDGTRGGVGATAEQVELWEAVEEVNRLFAASGLDLGNSSTEAWTLAVWGVLTDDPEVQAMSAENTDEQLKASPKFKDKVAGAIIAVASDSVSRAEATITNPELHDGLVELLARVTAIVHGRNAA